MAFIKAVKYNSKLRMALAGPAGAGKTWTALILATALAGGQGIAVIDTEHGSASKYADAFEFDSQELTNFHPQKYIDAIHEAEAGGYAVLVIDSLSHAWSGTGGLLEEKDKIAKTKYNGNSFSAWNDASAMQNKLVAAILGCTLHVIVTVRSKMDYIIENVNGKQTPRKLGMAPVQRDDLPYEFDVFASMDIDNTLIVDKSRCPALSGQVIAKPDARVADILKTWLDGVPVESLKPSEVDGLKTYVGKVFKFKQEDFDTRWLAYKKFRLNRQVDDMSLTLLDAATLRDFAEKEEAKNGAVTQAN